MMINTEYNQQNISAKLNYRIEGKVIHVSYQANGEPSPTDSLLYLALPWDGFIKLCTTKRKALKPLVRVARTWANAYKSDQGSTKSRNVLLEGKFVALTLRACSDTNFNTLIGEVGSYFYYSQFLVGEAHWLACCPNQHSVTFACQKNEHTYFDTKELASQEVHGRFDWLGRVFHSPEKIRLDEIINHFQIQKKELAHPKKNSSFLKMYGECQSTPDTTLDKGKIRWLADEIDRAGTGEMYGSWRKVLNVLSLNQHINPVRDNRTARQHKI